MKGKFWVIEGLDGCGKTTQMECLKQALEKRNKELSKAKELIQKLLYEYNYLSLIKSETKAEIEQFLKETEE